MDYKKLHNAISKLRFNVKYESDIPEETMKHASYKLDRLMEMVTDKSIENEMDKLERDEWYGESIKQIRNISDELYGIKKNEGNLTKFTTQKDALLKVLQQLADSHGNDIQIHGRLQFWTCNKEQGYKEEIGHIEFAETDESEDENDLVVDYCISNKFVVKK